MTRKSWIGVFLSVIMLTSSLTFTGCKKKIRDDEQFLEINITAQGYGSDWLYAVVDAFKNDAQVREKYPELDVDVSITTETSFAITDIESESTTADLYFAAEKNSSRLNLDDDGVSPYFEELTDLYELNVWGEETTMGDKMGSSLRDLYLIQKPDGSNAYYCMPYVAGTMSLLYNKTQFDRLGRSLPVTTDELLQLCNDISGQTVPFVFSTKINYWTTSAWLQWWAQYEGVKNYDNFYRGIYTDGDGRNKYSPEVFSQLGRLRSLETIYSLIGVEDGQQTNPNNHARVSTMTWMQAQSAFLLGESLMMMNGDWFANEMTSAAEEGITDDFGMMQLPVISSIVEQLEDKNMQDSTLAAVIRAIDSGATEYDGMSENDFARIREARNIMLPPGGEVAFIPAYAKAKELAKDFLRFFASDACCELFYENTCGASPAFKYDIETKNPELYESFYTMQRERIQMSKNAIYVMDFFGGYPTNYFGGLVPLQTENRMIEQLFVSQNEKDRKSPMEIYTSEQDYWTLTRWNNMLEASGI